MTEPDVSRETLSVSTERLEELYRDWLCLANPESETFLEYLIRCSSKEEVR